MVWGRCSTSEASICNKWVVLNLLQCRKKKKNKTNKNKRDLNPDKYLQSKLMMWEIKINWMTKTFLFHLIYYILFIPSENFKYEMKSETSKINSRIYYNWIKLATLCDYIFRLTYTYALQFSTWICFQ